MDISVARTFLEVVKTGSFVKAAVNLNLTQTAVSACIRVLEDQLDRPVFIRNKAGARRSEEHTSELQSLMRISYAVFCLKKKTHINEINTILHLTNTKLHTTLYLHFPMKTHINTNNTRLSVTSPAQY